MSRALVVIDMQPYFRSANDKRTILNVQKQIKLAMKRNAPIMYVEYGGLKGTHRRFTWLTRAYNNVHFIKKWVDGGGNAIEKYMERTGLKATAFRVCGVNTGACVASTVAGLVKRMPDVDIEVVKEACNSDCSHQRSWMNFQETVGTPRNVVTV